MKKHIVIIENNKIYALALQKKFEMSGHTAVTFDNGCDGIDYLSTNDVDALMLDYELPGINGKDVARILYDNPNLRNIPIVVISGNESLDMINMASEAGVNMIFRKKGTKLDDIVQHTDTLISISEKLKWIHSQTLSQS